MKPSFKLVTVVFCFIFIASFSFSISYQLLPTQAMSQQEIFSTPINLSNDSKTATFPNVFNYEDHVYAAWSEESNGILFRESPNGGVSWVPPTDSPALKISSPVGTAQYPLISANGSNVYVVWSQSIASKELELFEATSTNYGATFSPAQELTTGNVSEGYITPYISSWGSTVQIIYKGGDSNYVITSDNAGQTWSAPFAVGCREPQIANYGNNVYIATDCAGVAVSHNGGQTWSKLHIPGCCAAEPWVWTSDSNAYIAWETKGNTSQVYVTSSNNNGTTWSTPLLLSSDFTNSWQPMGWAVGNESWIAMQTNPRSSGQSQEYVYTTTNAGATWSSPVSLSGPPSKGTDTAFPFTAASSDGQNVFIGWSQQLSPGYWVFRVSYSSNGGSTWTSAPGIDVSQNNAGEASNNNDLATGAIAAYGTQCFAVWQYENGATNQIYFSFSS
jgi:hypothetical protein